MSQWQTSSPSLSLHCARSHTTARSDGTQHTLSPPHPTAIRPPVHPSPTRRLTVARGAAWLCAPQRPAQRPCPSPPQPYPSSPPVGWPRSGSAPRPRSPWRPLPPQRRRWPRRRSPPQPSGHPARRIRPAVRPRRHQRCPPPARQRPLRHWSRWRARRDLRRLWRWGGEGEALGLRCMTDTEVRRGWRRGCLTYPLVFTYHL